MIAGGFPEFSTELAYHESRGQYDSYKMKGPYYGKYQFGRARLCDLGLMDINGQWLNLMSREKFLANGPLQEACFVAHVSRLLKSIDSRYKSFYGTLFDGVEITASGLVAAAHLVGLGSVNTMLRNRIVAKDGNGTTAVQYMLWMGSYDLPRDMPMTIPEDLVY